MKKIQIFTALIGLLVLNACNQGSGNNNKGDSSNTTADTAKTKQDSDNNGAGLTGGVVPADRNDTLVFLGGTFAEWTKAPGEVYDGQYDTVNHIFMRCPGEEKNIVDEKQVILNINGACEGITTHVAEFMLVRDSSHIITLSDNLIGLDTSTHKAKAVFKLNGVLKEVAVERRTVDHIKRTVQNKKMIKAKRF